MTMSCSGSESGTRTMGVGVESEPIGFGEANLGTQGNSLMSPAACTSILTVGASVSGVFDGVVC